VYRDFDYTIILLKEKNLGNSYINNNVFIEKVECSIGKAYISKSSKQNNIYDGISHNSISLSSLIKNKIEDNEVGCYNEDGYKSTENEILTIKYSISEEDLNLNNYIHFFFSKSHFPIYKINVEGENFKISSSFLYKDVPVKINTKTGDFGIYKQIST
ncbi:MAG: hypothetical protein KC550_02695, partial [Nanoarchaeota archaeon]|nr:hypothetical protein [Nanoarchaeota archaeon]